MRTTADIAKEVVMRWKNDLYAVVDFQHVNPGKGSAFVRTRLKNVRTGKVIENTFKSGEELDIVDVEKKKIIEKATEKANKDQRALVEEYNRKFDSVKAFSCKP